MDKDAVEKKTLLIVDDVDINREILASIFDEQYSIMEAENGEEAMAKLQAFQKEIVSGV